MVGESWHGTLILRLMPCGRSKGGTLSLNLLEYLLYYIYIGAHTHMYIYIGAHTQTHTHTHIYI